MPMTLDDIGIQITSIEQKAIQNVLMIFEGLRRLDIDPSEYSRESYLSQTEHILEILEKEQKLLSNRTREFVFNELPAAFYVSLFHCVLLHPHVHAESTDTEIIFKLFVRIKQTLTQKGITI